MRNAQAAAGFNRSGPDTRSRSGGANGLHVDEDALAGAGERGVDDSLLVAGRDCGQAAPAPRIIEDVVALDHVGDPILQLRKHVGTVIDAQPVARAQVLIDPHPHAF
jgi:hypothetical protein